MTTFDLPMGALKGKQFNVNSFHFIGRDKSYRDHQSKLLFCISPF